MIKIKGILKKDNTFLAFATYFQVCLLMLQLLIFKLFFNGNPNSLVHIVIVIMAGIPMIKCALIWIKRCLTEFIATYFICIIVLMANYLMFPENREYVLFYTIDFFLMCIPCFLNCRLIDDESHSEIFVKLSFVILLLGEVYFVLDITKSIALSDYSMAYSYYMVVPSLAFIYLYYKKSNIIFLLLFFAPFISMLLIGSRGAVVSCIVFFVALVLMGKKSTPIKIGIITIIAIAVFNYREIIGIINKISVHFGVTSRTLQLLERGDMLSHDSGRTQLWGSAIAIIKENWFTGAGIGADLRLLGIYSHNIFLDLLMHFGYVFGGLLILLLFVLMIIGAIGSKDKVLYLMLLCYGFIPSLVSGTYLSSSALYVFLGYCWHSSGFRMTMISQRQDRNQIHETILSSQERLMQ